MFPKHLQTLLAIGALSGLFIEGDGQGGGGTNADTKPAEGAGEKAPVFDQAAVNALIAKERRAWEGKAAEAIKATEAKLSEASAKLEQIEREKELGNVTGKEREILQLKQTIAKYEADVKAKETAAAEATKAKDETVAKFRAHRASAEVKDALLSGGALKTPKTLDQATRLFMMETEAEITEDDKGGLVYGFTIDGKRYTDAAEAAKVWLALNDQYLTTPGGGSGARPPNGGGRSATGLADLSVEELAKLTKR
jgi:hypothetical protein